MRKRLTQDLYPASFPTSGSQILNVTVSDTELINCTARVMTSTCDLDQIRGRKKGSNCSVASGFCQGACRPAMGICRVNVDARISQQRRNHRGVASIRSPYERRPAITICRVHVEARRNQQRRDRLCVASMRHLHERRPANTICRVHVEARICQQRRDRLGMVSICLLYTSPSPRDS